MLISLAHVIGERADLFLTLGFVGTDDCLLQALRTQHRLPQLIFRLQRRPYERAGENGEGCDYYKHADQDLATTTLALDLANMLGTHTAANAAGMRGG